MLSSVNVNAASQAVMVDGNGRVTYPPTSIFFPIPTTFGSSVTVSNANVTAVTNLIVTGYITIPTNATPNGTVIDFGIQYNSTNAANNVSFLSFINVNPTNYNSTYVYVIPNGGNRTVTIPSVNWLSTDGNRSWTVTNNTIFRLFIEMQYGVFTNVTPSFRS